MQGVEEVRVSEAAATPQDPPSARSATAAAAGPAQDVDMDSLGDSLLADEALPPARLDSGRGGAPAAWSQQAAAVPAPLWKRPPPASAFPAQAAAGAATGCHPAARSPLAAAPPHGRLQLLTPPIRASPGAYCWA